MKFMDCEIPNWPKLAKISDYVSEQDFIKGTFDRTISPVNVT